VTNILELCAGLPVVSTPAGGLLIEEGTRPDRLLVLVDGEVTIERDGTPLARVDTPGAIFGEMSVGLGHPATATVRAAIGVRVHVVEDPQAFLVEQPGVALAVLRITAARLDGMTRYLTDVKQQLAGEDGHLGRVGQILDTLLHHQAEPAQPGSARDPEPHQHD